MLIEDHTYLYAYTITRDFGFAPNPFHGICTLATCKPKVRKGAKVGDWVLGVGGSNIRGASKKCILLMKITEKMTFQEYWDDPRALIKKPVRNGSPVRMVGDNIYHKDGNGNWLQEDSHHSLPDGTINFLNLERDTKSNEVLLSNFYLYFGDAAISIDLDSIGYYRIRDFRKIELSTVNNAGRLIASIVTKYQSKMNMVVSDPCHFKDSHKRVDQATGKLS